MESKKTIVYKSKMDGLWTVKYWTRYAYVPRYSKFSDWTDAIHAAFLIS